MSTDPAPSRSPSTSACLPYRALTTEATGGGRNARAIWQDLVDGNGFTAGYASVRRFVGRGCDASTPGARVVIITAQGREAQVDYGEGPDGAAAKQRKERAHTAMCADPRVLA